MNDFAPIRPALDRLQRAALLTGALALVACVVGAFFQPRQFFEAYLMAYLYWLGLTLGCLVITMIHHVAGGEWGYAVRRLLEAAVRTLPVMTVLFLPVLFGMRRLYIWTDANIIAADELLRHKKFYLNIPFFVIRAFIYFAAWGGTAYALDCAATLQDRNPSREATRKLTTISGVGLAAYTLTMTFAGMDWAMTLEPHWFSTMYGVLIMSGQVLIGFAFVIIVAGMLAERPPLAEALTPRVFHDLGNLLLTFVIFWAYIAFSQLLIVWSGNLSDENPWYLRRFAGGWQWWGVALVAAHFFIPFFLLLSRDIKSRSPWLAKVAWLVFAACYLDVFWIVAPGFGRVDFVVHWMDVLAPVGLGGVWIATFIGKLKQRSALPAHDSRVEEELLWA
jgi:hypothetical protein